MDIGALSEKGSEVYHRYCMKTDDVVKLHDVILSPENEEKLTTFMREQQNAEKLRDMGFVPVNRILMHGAPGTGKTYLSQAIANELGIPMLHIDISQLEADKMASVITDIFNLADEFERALIFLDECDSICWARDDMENSDSAAVRRANNVLFQQLDQMNVNHLFISATNLYNKLDAAFKRRFNIKMKFIAPKVVGFGEAVPRFMSSEFEYVRDMDAEVKAVIDDQAQNYASMSYFQIEDWVHQAEKAAVLEGRKKVLESEIYQMLMQEMRLEVKYQKNKKPYLHQYGVQNR